MHNKEQHGYIRTLLHSLSCLLRVELFAYWIIFHDFLSSADFVFQNQLFRKSLSGIPSVSNSLDTDQA